MNEEEFDNTLQIIFDEIKQIKERIDIIEKNYRYTLPIGHIKNPIQVSQIPNSIKEKIIGEVKSHL